MAYDPIDPQPVADKPVWDLAMAVETIRILQPSAKAEGYFLCLGGGVLNRGYSFKDLDIIAGIYTEELTPNPNSLMLVLLDEISGFIEKTEQHGRHTIVFCRVYEEQYKLEVWFLNHKCKFEEIIPPMAY